MKAIIQKNPNIKSQNMISMLLSSFMEANICFSTKYGVPMLYINTLVAPYQAMIGNVIR